METWFENLARTIYHNRIKTLIIMAVLIAAFISQLPKLFFDFSTEGFLHENDPTLIEYHSFRKQFGRDEMLIIAINPENIFTQKTLKKIKALHEDLKDNVPYLEDISSIVNARNTRGEGETLIVEDLLEKWPDSESDMEALKNRISANQMYTNMLISEDGRFTTMILKTQNYSHAGKDFDVLDGFEEDGAASEDTDDLPVEKDAFLSNAENAAFVMAVQDIVKKYEGPDFPVYVAGTPAVTHFLKQSMIKDMRKFMGLAIATIVLVLFIMFRKISGVILPIIVVLVSLLSTISIMAAAGVPIKLPTQIIPSFLLAVGVGASVHILAIFFQHFRQHNNKEEAIAYAIGHSGLAVVMTHVTTASGLLSFSTANVAPIADLGIFAGIGIMLALVYTIVLLPALLAVFPIKHKMAGADTEKPGAMDRFLTHVGNFSTRRPWLILITTAIIIVLSIISASTIRFSHDILSWFPENSPVRMATEKIDHELRGSITLEIIIDTGIENGLFNPAILNGLEKAAAYAESIAYDDIFVGKAWSIATLLKEIHQALNENRPEFYTIPQNRDLIAQEFLLFENSGSDDLEDFVDSQFSKARFTIKIPFRDAVKYNKFLNIVNRYLTENLPAMDITTTGMIALLFKTASAAIVTMAKSYLTALVVITFLMIFLIGKVRIGLLSMIPNLAPIIVMLGIMGAFSLPMDLFSMMVGSIAIGLAVDDTIHFMHNFRRYFEKSNDPATAVHQTLQTAGRAMLVTTIVLSLGFFIFMFASMNNLFNFGALTGLTIIMALLSDYLLAPALMMVVNRGGRKESA